MFICTLGPSGGCVYSTILFPGLQLACSEPAKPSPLQSDSYLALGLSTAQILGLENADSLQNQFKAETTKGNL